MKPLFITAVGAVDASVMRAVETGIGRHLGLETRRLPALPEPEFAWDAGRCQFSSSAILSAVVDRCPPGVASLAALTEADLFIPMLTFIYGQAQLGGVAALISLARLRQEFYGLPADPHLLADRAVKETLHEVGHTLGLIHCLEKTCVMALATSIRQLDLKAEAYCKSCAARVRRAVQKRLGEPEGYHAGTLEDTRRR